MQVVLEVVKCEVSVWGRPSFGGNGVECSKKMCCKNRHSHGFGVLQAALPMRGQWFLAAHAATRRSCSPPVFCELILFPETLATGQSQPVPVLCGALAFFAWDGSWAWANENDDRAGSPGARPSMGSPPFWKRRYVPVCVTALLCQDFHQDWEEVSSLLCWLFLQLLTLRPAFLDTG